MLLMKANMISVILVAAGGALGALARYGVSTSLSGASVTFPLGTLIVNLAGCFLMGIVYALSSHVPVLSPATRLFLATGFCGGFTTMSTFMYEIDGLVRDREVMYGLLYAGATIAGSFACFILGALVIRALARV